MLKIMVWLGDEDSNLGRLIQSYQAQNQPNPPKMPNVGTLTLVLAKESANRIVFNR